MQDRWKLISIAALLLVGIAAAGQAPKPGSERTVPIACVSGEEGVGCAADDAEIAAAPAQGMAQDFTLRTLDGDTLTLSEVRAGKPAILDFWASWCPHCQRNMPKLDALYRQYQDRISVIGINMKEDPDDVRRFIEANGITYPIVLDAGDVARQYGVRYTNTHILIDKDGSIADILAGDIGEDRLQALLSVP